MNHLVIGLGGTGGKIIRALRKIQHQERQSNPSATDGIAYLYVDSSDEMMGIDDPSWKILGTSVQLSKGSQLLIRDADLVSRLENIDNYPGLKGWVGDKSDWKDILNSIVGATLGGQKRRLGRFLFACKAHDYKAHVQTQVQALQKSGEVAVTFHVIAGLAGGTGSGSIIDAISILRDTYPDSKRYKILVYALLPDAYPLPNWDTGNYHANGFAALTELNALSVGAYAPYDVTGVKTRLSLVDPFNGCFVFTNENENGLTVDVSADLPGIVADFLYQKIVVAKSVGWESLSRMENAENGDGSPEKSPYGNNPERSKRFLTFGIKRLAVPEEEIGEFLTYSFAQQAVLQLKYNNWQPSAGFLDEVKNQNFAAVVQDQALMNRWLLTDAHITLEVGILPDDVGNKLWQSFGQEWGNVIPKFKQVAMQQQQKKWLNSLALLCQQRFDDSYRNLGVLTFYRTKAKASKEMACEIRGHIERELMNEWRVGARSLWDISRLLVELEKSLEGRSKQCNEKIVQARQVVEAAQNLLTTDLKEWADLGFFSKMVNRHENILNSHGVHLQELYVSLTQIEAWGFAKNLLLEVIEEVTDLRAEVDRAAKTLQTAIDKFDVAIRSRLSENEVGRDLKQYLIRFYDPALVRHVCRKLLTNESEQKSQTSRVRAALAEKIGDKQSFRVFNQRVSEAVFLDVLENVCEESSRIAHQNIVQNQKEKLIGVPLMEKLRDRYGVDTHALRTYVSQLVSQAGNFVALDPLEQSRVAPGINMGSPSAVNKFTVIMPKAESTPEFSDLVKRSFREAKTGDVEIIETDGRFHEIILVSISNLLPLRYLKPLKFLEEKYRRRVDVGGARATMEVHTEGDGSAWPRLFVASSDEIKQQALPYLLLAKCLGFIAESENPETGVKDILFLSKDEYGFDNDPIILGSEFIESAEHVKLDHLQLIKSSCADALNTKYRHEGKKSELIQAVLQEVEKIKQRQGGNMQDPLYRKFLDAGKKVVGSIKSNVAAT